MISFLKTMIVVLATGFILFFLSERVFWSFWKETDRVGEAVITWLVYSLITWLFLILVRRFRVASLAPLVLCGALFGWMAEGIVVDTLYGGPTNPLPLSISFTGLSWHALLSVVVGWCFVGRALAEPSPRATLILASAIGIAWGLWALWWPTELQESADTSIAGFATHTIAVFLPYLLAWVVLALVPSSAFRPSKAATRILSGLVVVIFLGVQVPARPVVAWILPILVVPCLIALKRNADREQRPDLLDDPLSRLRLPNIPALLLMPSTAILVYAVLSTLAPPLPTNILLYVITMPLGFWFFFRSLWVLLRRRPTLA